METEPHENCSICMSTLTDTNTSTTPCDHVFHFACLLRWSNTSNVCPECRAELGPAAEVEPSTRTVGNSVGLRNLISDDQGSEIDLQINAVDLRAEILAGFLHGAVRDGNLSLSRTMVNENPHLLYSPGDMGDLLTHDAVISGNDTILTFLLSDKSMNPNLSNDARMFPLHYAVMSGSVRMVNLLLNRGAFVDCVNNSWMTPLMIACEQGSNELTELLLDKNASTLNTNSDGRYPLHIAAKAKSHICVRKLLVAEADVDAEDDNEDTPLHISCRLGFHTVTRKLLEGGAETDCKNKFGNTPLEDATENNHTSVRNLLMRYVG